MNHNRLLLEKFIEGFGVNAYFDKIRNLVMDKIFTIPNEMYFSADVFLSKGLITTYGDTLTNTQQLMGDAEILTDESSLQLQFFSPLQALIVEKVK